MKISDGFELLATSPDGVARLRELVLALAVRGRLVPQDPVEEPASILLEKIQAEKHRLARGLQRGRPLPVANEQTPYTLPASWQWVRLPDIYDGISPSNRKLLSSKIENHGEVPVVDQGKRQIAGYTDDTSLRINIPGPVIVFGDHTTEVKYVDFDFVAGADGVKILRPILQDERFFYYQVRAYKLEDRGYARHFKVLNSNLFALPPLAEQSRIVGKVDELMRLCDELETRGRLELDRHAQLTATLFETLATSESAHALSENWARVAAHFDVLLDRPEAVDALEQIIVHLAVRGLLVQQDKDDKPANELLQQIRQEKDRLIADGTIRRDKPLQQLHENSLPYEVPNGWVWTRFGAVILDSEAGWSPSCENVSRASGQWGVLKVSAVSWGQFRPEENKELPAGLIPKPEYEVVSGDFLLSRANTDELVARSVIVEATEPKLMMSDKIIRLKLSALVDPQYLNLFNNSKVSRGYYVAHASGTSSSMKNVSREVILNLPVALPPVAEQSRIVSRVDELRRLCADLRARLTTRRTCQARFAETLIEQDASTAPLEENADDLAAAA